MINPGVELAGYFTIYEWTVLVIWAVFWIYWIILAFLTRSPVKKRWQSGMPPVLPGIAVLLWVIFSVFFPGFLLLPILPAGILTGLPGIALTLAGLGFAVWARLHLGKNWSGKPVIRTDHVLIRTGPYHVVRNPIYTGILAALIGTALVVGQIWVLMVTAIILVVFLIKIGMEEKFLLEEFGESFISYKNQVKSLIPYIL